MGNYLAWFREHFIILRECIGLEGENEKCYRLRMEAPCRISSDLHEWCNNCPAVSNMDSVKLNSP
jgi:hypothetical protein